MSNNVIRKDGRDVQNAALYNIWENLPDGMSQYVPSENNQEDVLKIVGDDYDRYFVLADGVPAQ